MCTGMQVGALVSMSTEISGTWKAGECKNTRKWMMPWKRKMFGAYGMRGKKFIVRINIV